MSVKTDAGRRYIEVETVVPGTPEEVWEAIASGPGISSWFVPTDLEQKVGGRKVAHFGPGMDSGATVEEWEAPRRFSIRHDPGPHGPVMGSEWLVEAREGGYCRVRVVNSLFTDSDEWDGQITGLETGWPGFFRILDLYLRHFRGLPASSFLAMAFPQGSEGEAWEGMLKALGFSAAATGDAVRTAEGAPRLAGKVEAAGASGDAVKHFLLLRCSEPGDGIASFGAHNMGGQTCAALTYYQYGEGAAEKAAAAEAEWGQWLKDFASAG
jgi:uncharacterized protein YndB with AHSA1/START domain